MKISTATLLALAGLGLTHPGHKEPEHELLYKRQYNAHARRGLANCAEQLEERGVNARAKSRREATAQKHRRLLQKRVSDTVTSEHLLNTNYSMSTPSSEVFDSNICVLTPEGLNGPFFVKGEQIRSDIRENQAGVPIVVEAQFIDVETCEPVPDVYWEMWSVNATGVYSGIVAAGNGNEHDLENINKTFLRGVQKTDFDGVAVFQSIFPGHYVGRASHIHFLAAMNATVLPNNTISAGHYSHIGQGYWDQELLERVESTYPYNLNNITITKNVDDIFIDLVTANTTSDTIFNSNYLGEDLSDGIFGWITIVINTTASYEPPFTFELTEDGGKVVPVSNSSVPPF